MLAARRMTAVALLGAAVLSGCASTTKSSATKFTGESKAVAQAVEDLQSAGKKKDATRICDDLLATPVVARLKASPGAKNDCSNALSDSLDDADTFDMTVQKVAISGTTATATVKSEAGKKDPVDTLTFVKEGQNWKLSAIGS
jgi:ketosteroid isomerase-like protein